MNINDVSRRWRTRPTISPSTLVSTNVAVNVTTDDIKANSQVNGQVNGKHHTAIQETPSTRVTSPTMTAPTAIEPLSASSASVRNRLKKNQRRSLEELQRVWQRLAVNILASNAQHVPWTMGIGSAIRGEGRTTTAIGLATAIARETGEKVALLDLDLENPSISEEIRPGTTPGLIQVLRGEAEFEETFRSTVGDKIVVIPGSTGWKQSALTPTFDDLAVRLRHQIPDFIESLKSQFNYTVADLPPVLSNMQTERIAISLSGTLMVVRSGITPMNLIRESVELMGDDNLLGAIQVGQPSPVPAWLSNLLAG